MSGGYTERGPVPKRSQARRRRNKTDENGESIEVDEVQLDPEAFPEFAPRPANPNWHPAAKAMWDAACESGQRIFWEPSDWALLALTCSQIDQEYSDELIIEKVKQPMIDGEGGGEELVYGSRPMPAGKFAAILKAFSALGMTEGDRRRMRMELNRVGQPEEEASPEEIAEGQLSLIQGGRSDVG